MAEYVVLRTQVVPGFGQYLAGQILTGVGPPTISALIGAGLSVAPIIPPPGSTTNFLRQDGQWVPAAGGAAVIEHATEFIAAVSGAPQEFTDGSGVGSSSGACSFYCSLPSFHRGDVISAIEVTGTFGVTPGTYPMSLVQREGQGAFPRVTTVQAFSPTLGGATQITTLTLTTPKVVVANKTLLMLVSLLASQDRASSFAVHLQ